MMTTHYDYIVVGAGSAGCAAAYRLAEQSESTVLLIEAGTHDKQLPIKVPIGFSGLLSEGKNNWNYMSAAEPGLAGRSIPLPRGKVWGGCSSINGMVYIRGQREDYDTWAEQGNTGWAYDDVLPFFKRSENYWGGASDYHGSGGPLDVNPVNKKLPVGDAFICAAIESGIPNNNDFNGPSQQGVGYFDANITQGIRHSSARAFLSPRIKPKNLSVLSQFEVNRIIFNHKRATGIEGSRGGILSVLSANKEVIIAAGAFNTPKLLELSGIGQAERLQSLGIKPLVDLPAVGENLQDHCNTYLYFDTQHCETYYDYIRWWRAPVTALSYLFRRQGIFANPAAQVGAFFSLDNSSSRPDTQIHFAAGSGRPDKNGNMIPEPGVCASVCQLRPRSVGCTHIVSDQAMTPPAIQLNLLNHADDQRHQLAAVRKLRAIFSHSGIAPMIAGELPPLAGLEGDDELLNAIRQHSESVHHPVGTCRMGIDDNAVVRPDLKVIGVEGLRIADASIMPSLISGNTHAACVMIGEKLADLVLSD